MKSEIDCQRIAIAAMDQMKAPRVSVGQVGSSSIGTSIMKHDDGAKLIISFRYLYISSRKQPIQQSST